MKNSFPGTQDSAIHRQQAIDVTSLRKEAIDVTSIASRAGPGPLGRADRSAVAYFLGQATALRSHWIGALGVDGPGGIRFGLDQVPGSMRVVTAIRFQALIVRIRLISWASSGPVNSSAASSQTSRGTWVPLICVTASVRANAARSLSV